jgi:hypothetical protein
MERRIDNKMMTWDDGAVKKITFKQFRESALHSKVYLSIPGKENREKVILEDYQKITGKNVEAKPDDTVARKSKPVKGGDTDNKGE